MKKKKIGFGAIAVVAAIDMTGRVVAKHIVDRSITGESFIIFLEEVAKFTQKSRALMVVDNLALHRMTIVRNKASQLNIDLCYNGIYSSADFMPIERIFSWTKARF